jgi:benzodiazapine receptor
MTRSILKQTLNALAVIATITVNGLANALPLNGLNTGEISDRFQVYFVPAGYVFSIWGLIYLGLIAFTVYQALPAQRSNPRLRSIDIPFVLSCLANIVWLFLWHYLQFPLTLVVMLCLLGLLITIYLRLEIGRARVSSGERWCVHLPFSVYLGWVTVATIANATDVLDYLKWGGWGIPPQVWAVIMLVVATGITLWVSLTRRDAAFLLVIVWAFVGIAIKQAGAPLVANTAWVLSAFLVIWLATSAILFRKSWGTPAPAN